MADFDFTTLGYIIVAAVLTGIVTWFLQSRTRKDSVAQTAINKRKDEIAMARDLTEERLKAAKQVKEEMLDKVTNLFASLKSEIALEQQKIYSIFGTDNANTIQLRKDFEEFKNNIYRIVSEFKRETEKIHDGFRRDIERIQTMSWGSDAKSVPPQMTGKEETQAHKDKPDEGVFYKQTEEEISEQTKENEERLSKEKED